MCPACRGRGEVPAGITFGRNLGQPDSSGVERREATRIEINRDAWDARNKTIWFLDYNTLVPLWSTAVCMRCRGSGEETEQGYARGVG